METLIHDIRYAIRDLLKARVFATIAIATLALGIGAPTAMFTVINALLLRPLPFRAPERLVAVKEFDIRQGPGEGGALSYPDFIDLRARSHAFEALAAYHDIDFTATGVGDAVHVHGENVSANAFQLLGASPAMGRSFLPDEDGPGHHVAILSDEFWRRHFHADPAIVGRSIGLNGRAFTVIGVMRRGFQFPIREESREMWLTFSREAEPDTPGDPPNTEQRGEHYLEAIGRLKQGATIAQANADAASVANALRHEYPKTNSHFGMQAEPELKNLIGDTSKTLFMLLGAVGLVLLIACANVANLLLSRGSGRAREIAIRSAVGATRVRIVRQLITESVVLSLGGGGLGFALASWSLNVVLRLYPANLPRAAEISIDYRVAFFTFALAVLTGILFGLVPALRTSTPNLSSAMREGGRSATAAPRQNRLRSGLVIAETALGVMLLIGAGLLMRSLDRLSHASLGFNPEHLLTADFDLSETRYNPDQQDRFINSLVDRLRTLPGVTAAAGALPLPLSENHMVISFDLLDHPTPEGNHPNATFYIVVPGFLQTMQIPLLQGRTFGPHDQRNAKPVMIVTQAFAKKFFPNEDPIGKRVKIGASEGAARAAYATREIVGVVGDIRTSNLAQDPAPAYYIPLPQLMFGPPTLVIRTAGEPLSLTQAVHKVLSSMDPETSLYGVRSMADYLALDLGRARFQTVLLSCFAGIALLLTAMGVYGVISYAVTQRTNEIGLRMALGASRSDVLQMILQHGMLITAAGIAVGVVAAAVLARLLSSLLYNTPPRDPLTYCSVCIVLALVALLASYMPALRATRVDPNVALRVE